MIKYIYTIRTANIALFTRWVGNDHGPIASKISEWVKRLYVRVKQVIYIRTTSAQR